MADLYPTKTRLALLRNVQLGLVFRNGTDPESYLTSGSGSGANRRTVTDRIAELCRAGWAEPGPQNQHDRLRPYQITDLGEAVLDADAERHQT